MQVAGAAHGVGPAPRRTRLKVLLALVTVVVIAVMVVALMVWAAPLATSGVGTEDANRNVGAGSAVIHDDAGNLIPKVGAGFAVIHDDAGKMIPDAGAGSAIVHDDAGKMKR